MFTTRLKAKFKENEPIFTEEILNLYPDYSRAQVFRYVAAAKDTGELLQFDKGVYYLPKKTLLGKSLITSDNVVEKKYIIKDNHAIGIYSGLKLFNLFSMTTQMPAVIEIVSNNESSKRREIVVKNRTYILRKSRFEIDNNNVGAYTILQLFSDIDFNTKINNLVKNKILEYAKTMNVTKEQLMCYVMNFSSKTAHNLIRSGVLNEITI